MIWTDSIILLAILFFLAIERSTQKQGIPPMPSLPHQRHLLLKSIEKYLSPTIDTPVFYDLGSGWGGLIAAIARTFRTAHIHGFEIFWPGIIVSRLRFIMTPRVHIHCSDLFQSNLTDADVIVCYLSRPVMARLEEKFKSELRPGTLILSISFPMPQIPPIETLIIPGPVKAPIYIYRINYSTLSSACGSMPIA